MAKQPRKRPETALNAARPVITVERFLRLYHLVELLGGAAQDREKLARKLRMDVRGFYRDLDLLRKAAVAIALHDGRYSLSENVESALARLPFPDPRLTLGEARLLAKGRTKIHEQLKAQIQGMLPG